MRDFLTDSSQSHDSERLAAELRPNEAALFPALVLHRVIGGRHRARQGQHQRARVLGDADAVRAGGVDDEDAARAGGRHVDVVDAGAGPGDNPEPRGGRQQFGVDLRRAPHEQRIGVGKIRRKLGAASVGSRVDRPACFVAQQVQGGRGQIIGNNDFHCEMQCQYNPRVFDGDWPRDVARPAVVQIAKTFQMQCNTCSNCEPFSTDFSTETVRIVGKAIGGADLKIGGSRRDQI